MAVKPETNFIKSILKYLPQNLYHMKNSNPYMGGVADLWFSGNKRDLWIETKYLQKLPVKVPVKIDLSQLQVLWLCNRHNEGRNLAVVVGAPEGCLLLTNLEWERSDITSTEFKERCMSRKDLAAWILRETVEE